MNGTQQENGCELACSGGNCEIDIDLKSINSDTNGENKEIEISETQI